MLKCLSAYVPSLKDGDERERIQAVTRLENVGKMSKGMDSLREEWKGSKNDKDNDFRRGKAIWIDSVRTMVIKITLFMRTYLIKGNISEEPFKLNLLRIYKFKKLFMEEAIKIRNIFK